MERETAMKILKELHNKSLFAERTALETIIPELKESEDGKIRKALVRFHKSTIDIDGIKGADILAWLEKQCTPAKLNEEEQNRFAKGVLSSCALSFINYLDAHSYEGKMCVSNGECEDIENTFHNAMWDRLHRYYCKYIEKQDEQKPAWSEEDEEMTEDLIKGCVSAEKAHHFLHTPKEVADWLKSLKDRVQGKED